MARTTQYIGLSPRAWEILRKGNYKILCEYHMTEGMFNEPVKGGIYECTFQREGMYSCPDNKYMEDYVVTYIEMVQAEPWSSGPMIFTYLKDVQTGVIVGAWTEEEIYN